jgi:DNA-binding HxlR family transcriptional regulator
MASCLTSERHAGILAALAAGATKFDDLADYLPPGTSRDRLVVLLRELRDAGFVGRSTEAGPPLRVSYRLTDDGRKLLDLTVFLNSWLSNEQEDESAARFWTNLRGFPVASAARRPRPAVDDYTRA